MPVITSVEIIEDKKSFFFRFFFSNNTYIDTNDITRPVNQIIETYVVGGGGGGGGSSTPFENHSIQGATAFPDTDNLEFSDKFTLTQPSAGKVLVELAGDLDTKLKIYNNGTFILTPLK